MNKTGIQYLDFTWNPVTGCTNGCPECWARALVERMLKNYALRDIHDKLRGFKPVLYPNRLDQPARRKKSSVIGVCFMGDLFDPGLNEGCSSWRLPSHAVMDAMVEAPQHTYILLTKQPEEMARQLKVPRSDDGEPPIQNWYLGFSARTQAEFDAGWPHMAKLAAAGWKVWVSLEPMQERVDISNASPYPHWSPKNLSTVIVGAQSPTGPWSDDWARSVRDQCAAAGVPFMHKQGLDARDKVVKLPMLDGAQHTELAWRLS